MACMLEIYRYISIRDLPEGYFKEQLTKLVEDDKTQVCVVGVCSGGPDWAAYIGWPAFHLLKREHQSSHNEYYSKHVKELEDVKNQGDKLPEDDAREIFPQLAKSFRYRR